MKKKKHQIISTQCFNILKYYTHPQIYALIKQLRREHVNVVVDHLKKKNRYKSTSHYEKTWAFKS